VSERREPVSGRERTAAGGDECAVLEELDRRLGASEVQSILDDVTARLERRLDRDKDTPSAYEPIPLEVYGPHPPGGVRSSWIFALRRGRTSVAERHPNSRQRMTSYRNEGDVQTFEDGRWVSHSLAGRASAPLGERWLSIPPNVWHRVRVAEPAHWSVVSFHTVDVEELIEETPVGDDGSTTRRRRYSDPEQARGSCSVEESRARGRGRDGGSRRCP
jgi:hypothetical protein